MRKKHILTTLVLTSLLTSTAYAAEGYNDFIDVGHNFANEKYFSWNGTELIKGSLAGEKDTIKTEGNRITMDVYQEIDRDKASDRGVVFALGSDRFTNKEIVVNLHNNATFAGGYDASAGHPAFAVGQYGERNDVIINMDEGKNLKFAGSTNEYNNWQAFQLEGNSTVAINKGNLVVDMLYPKCGGDYGAAIFVEENSKLNINNDSVKIIKSYNRDDKLWEGWQDYGLYSADSKININTKDLYIRKNNETKSEEFDFGLTGFRSKYEINANNVAIFGKNMAIYNKKSNTNIKAESMMLSSDKDSIFAENESNIKIDTKDIQINGDIESINSFVNITSEKNALMNGDLNAKEQGVIHINLTGGQIEGNANNHVLYRPADEKGSINLDLINSTWISRYESSIDNLNLNNSTVDLTKDEAAFVMVDKLSGDGTFNMTLNSVDHKKGDMLYIGTNNGHQTVNIVGGITGGWENISEENPLRFATVAKENGDFQNVQAYTKDAGVWNLEYVVKKEKFDKNDAENEEYNGQGNGGSSHEIGNDFVENKLVGNNTNAQNWVITGVKAPTDNNGGNNQGNNQENNNSGTQISDAGKTILAMSKVNYANAVYMDRLNKRMGEANYIDGDDGLWLRIRHDRIGKENAFRSKNTMFEVGYDNKVNNKENHRQGIAFDSMRGSADYSNVIGSGNIHRAGVWLYDTKYDEKGAYTDFVIKAGKLTNDFDLLAKTTGENIHGEYDNMVYSASAEYGKKIAWKNDWYIEPQAQIQYAHVTGADYTTSQGTQVELEGIDSLIARAGLKIGKDINQKDNIYFKADILHEFLGEQEVFAKDNTGRLYQEYENKGTWYDLGFGFSHRFDEKTYMYADVEQSFGNDNEDTYQFNLGLNVKF